jgi:hypothetical protein
MNRTSKRISEYPFQPVRRNTRRLLQSEHRSPNDLPVHASLSQAGREGTLIDS